MGKSVTSIILVTCLSVLIPYHELAYCDVIELKDGGETMVGKITEESETHLTVKLKTGGTFTFPKSWAKSIKREDIPEHELYTKQDLYLIKFKRINPKDANAHLQLGEWCLKNATAENGLFELADNHFRIARELNPKLAQEAEKEFRDAQNKAAKRLYSIAEIELKDEEYLKSEKLVFSILSSYPDTDYASKAKGLLIKIWGRERVDRLLKEKDDLPEVILDKQMIYSILTHLKTQERKEKYLMKCLNKAMDFEERAQEVARDKKHGYYISAINCYEAALNADRAELRNLAQSKHQELLKKFFEDKPIPYSDARYALLTNYLNRIKDASLLEGISNGYFGVGENLYKRAKKSKQSESQEKVRAALFCFSIVNNHSKDEKLRQAAFNYIVECQRLAREVK